MVLVHLNHGINPFKNLLFRFHPLLKSKLVNNYHSLLNTERIKIIYFIVPTNLMTILDVSEKWRNGHNRSFSKFDPDDHRLEVRANGNTLCLIDGNGNCTLREIKGEYIVIIIITMRYLSLC